MALKEQIESGNKKVEEAKEIYLQHLRAYEAIKFPVKHEQDEILEKFRQAINALPENKGTCRCDRSYYDDAWFTADGISMRIDADHPNDIIDMDWTWGEVEQVLSV